MQIRTDISVQWRSKCKRSTTSLTILSPYITGDSALSLVEGKPDARVYTLFKAQVFASGSSQIEAIARLVREGYQVFHLPNLHAKVVMDGSSFVTIGSQNLTGRGSKINRELSVCLQGDASLGKVGELIEPWLNEAKVVTPEMVDDMIKALPDLRKAFREFSDACELVQREIEANEERRQREVMLKSKLQRQRGQENVRRRVRAKVNQATRSSSVKYGIVSVEDIDKSPTLKALQHENFEEWEMEGAGATRSTPGRRPYLFNTIRLRHLGRYLCVLESGEFGWARVAKGQITKIIQRLALQEVLPEFPLLEVAISASPQDFESLPSRTNLAVFLSMQGHRICTVPMEFEVDSLHAFRPIGHPLVSGTTKPTRRQFPTTREFINWMKRNKQVFEGRIRTQVVESFDFAAGSKLLGVNANRFFGPVGTRCQLEVVTIDNHPVLDVTPL